MGVVVEPPPPCCAVAPLATAAVATHFGGNYRVAFSLVMPISFIGAACLLAARRHIERDTAKIFESIAVAVEDDKARHKRNH